MCVFDCLMTFYDSTLDFGAPQRIASVLVSMLYHGYGHFNTRLKGTCPFPLRTLFSTACLELNEGHGGHGLSKTMSLI